MSCSKPVHWRLNEHHDWISLRCPMLKGHTGACHPFPDWRRAGSPEFGELEVSRRIYNRGRLVRKRKARERAQKRVTGRKVGR